MKAFLICLLAISALAAPFKENVSSNRNVKRGLLNGPAPNSNSQDGITVDAAHQGYPREGPSAHVQTVRSQEQPVIHQVSSTAVQPQQERQQVVQNFPAPSSQPEYQQFVRNFDFPFVQSEYQQVFQNVPVPAVQTAYQQIVENVVSPTVQPEYQQVVQNAPSPAAQPEYQNVAQNVPAAAVEPEYQNDQEVIEKSATPTVQSQEKQTVKSSSAPAVHPPSNQVTEFVSVHAVQPEQQQVIKTSSVPASKPEHQRDLKNVPTVQTTHQQVIKTGDYPQFAPDLPLTSGPLPLSFAHDSQPIYPPTAFDFFGAGLEGFGQGTLNSQIGPNIANEPISSSPVTLPQQLSVANLGKNYQLNVDQPIPVPQPFILRTPVGLSSLQQQLLKTSDAISYGQAFGDQAVHFNRNAVSLGGLERPHGSVDEFINVPNPQVHFNVRQTFGDAFQTDHGIVSHVTQVAQPVQLRTSFLAPGSPGYRYDRPLKEFSF